MRCSFVLPLLCLMFVVAVPLDITAAPPVFEVDHEFYPYYPSLVKWNKSSAEFTDPATCGGCHPQQYEEWIGSVHSLAFQDPVYQGELNKGFQEMGPNLTRQCEGCHTPIGVVTGEVTGPGLTGLSTIAMAGVSCDVCHSISGTTHTQTPSRNPQNGSMILTPGYETLEGTVLVKRGPSPPTEGCGGGFHECVESPLHLRADLCASCHQVYHYDRHFPLEATYNEWKAGPYAQNSILCQDCHMVDIDVFMQSAGDFRKPERGEYRHFFNGANYLLYSLAQGAALKAGDEALAANLGEKYEMAVARLQAAAELEVTPIYREGSLAEVKVRVLNVRAGHNLPTSLTNVRQLWLELTASDENGQVLMTSGSPDERGKLPEDTRMFNSEGMGDDFHFAIDPWVVTAFSRHDTIPPRGYREAYYGITPPEGVEHVTIEARLRYRQADQEVAEAVLATVPDDIDLMAIYGLEEVPLLPILDLYSHRETFSVSR
jgi:hypothetical protein